LESGNPLETKCCSIGPTFTIALNLTSLTTPIGASVSTLARQYEGKAVLGHLNRSINLMIKAAPGSGTGPLEAITMKNGDCKSYSIAKYAAARVARSVRGVAFRERACIAGPALSFVSYSRFAPFVRRRRKPSARLSY
jgi:hypothetical protein